jgi:ribosome-associated protein
VLWDRFSDHLRSPPLTPSPAHDAQDDAVSNTAHEIDPIEPLHTEDGAPEDDDSSDFSLFGTGSEGVEPEDDDAPFTRDAPLPVGSTAIEQAVLAKLDEDKAQDIVLIDLKGKSPMADTMIVASGRSHRHVGALADHLLRTLKDHGLGRAKVEGLPHCDWVLIDAGDVIVHLFRPEVRVFYNIEKIWAVDSAHRGAASA